MAQEHVDYLNTVVRDELIKASVAMYKAQPANKHQFLADYFAKLSAEREGGAPPAKGGKGKDEKKEGGMSKKEANKAAKKAKKEAAKAKPAAGGAPAPPKKKKVKMPRSDVIIECTPDTSIEYDWEQVKKDAADILLDGVRWGMEFSLVPFVFGIQKLVIVCQIMDAMVPTTTVITEALMTVKGIGGAEMVSIETAGVDWEAEGTGRIGTKRVAIKGGKAEGKKSKKSKKSKEAPKERVVTPEAIKKDAAKIHIAAKESDWFVANVPECDGSAQTNVSIAQLQDVLKEVRTKLPDVGILIIAAGRTKLSCLASIPPAQRGKGVACQEWIKSLLVFPEAKGDANEAGAELDCDPDKDEFPIKMKDSTAGNAFAFLKKLKFLDEGSEDEFYDMPGEEGY